MVRGSIGTLTATPAFDGGFLYVPSSNNNLYKLSTSNGSITATLSLGGPLSFAALITSDRIYVTSSNGMLYAINKSNFTKAWEYNGQSPAQTPPAFSSSRNTVIFGTQDLYVHAVNVNGTQKWRVKPTDRTPGDPGATAGNTNAEFSRNWPVVAESHGIVFIRYRLDWNTLWTGNPFLTSNSAIKSLLGDNIKRTLYALNLDNGQSAFYPAVGNAASRDGNVFQMGPMPVVATIDGKEVAYIVWRNGLTCQGQSSCDGREDATMGEMVLDSSTVSGYSAGDVRFVKFTDIQTDEAMFLTMGGKTLIHNHWLSAQMHQITDRSAGKGGTFSNPITTTNAPFVIWGQVYCLSSNSQCNPQTCPGCTGSSYGPSNCPFNGATRYCSQGTYTYGDSRQYPAGFYEYHNDANPRTSRSLPFVIPL